MNPEIDNWLVYYVAEICYLAALLNIIGKAVFITSDLTQGIIGLILAAVWYQCGTGVLKRRNRERKIAIVFLSIALVLQGISLYTSHIVPLLHSNIHGIGFGRWILLVSFVATLAALIILAIHRIRVQFHE